MSKKIIILTLFLIIGFGLVGAVARAQSLVDTNPSTDLGAKYQTGNYTLDDFVVMAVNAAKWILGIVGSLSLIMFIYGGVMFLISAGSSETISKAKKVIIAAVVGLIIVFASWLVIHFVLQTLNPNINWTGQKININDFK